MAAMGCRLAVNRRLMPVAVLARGLRCAAARLRVRQVAVHGRLAFVAHRRLGRTVTHHRRLGHMRLHHWSPDGYIHLHSGFCIPCCCGGHKKHTRNTEQTLQYVLHHGYLWVIVPVKRIRRVFLFQNFKFPPFFVKLPPTATETCGQHLKFGHAEGQTSPAIHRSTQYTGHGECPQAG